MSELTLQEAALAGVRESLATVDEETRDQILAKAADIPFTGDVDAYVRAYIALATPILHAKLAAAKAEGAATRRWLAFCELETSGVQ